MGRDIWSSSSLQNFEAITEEADLNDIKFLRSSNLQEAREYGAKSFPAIILFFNKIPILYKGNAEENDEIVDWLSTQIGVKPIIDEADNFFFPAADAKKVEEVVEKKEEKAVKKP